MSCNRVLRRHRLHQRCVKTTGKCRNPCKGFRGVHWRIGAEFLTPSSLIGPVVTPYYFLPNFFLNNSADFLVFRSLLLQLDFRSVFAAYKETSQNHGGANTVLLSNPQSRLLKGALTIRPPTLRLCYNSTRTIRPSFILSHVTIYCYTLSPIWYVQGLNVHQGKSGHSVACFRTSNGDQRHVHLTECPPYGTSTFVRRKIWSVTPNRGLSTHGLVCRVPNLTQDMVSQTEQKSTNL